MSITNYTDIPTTFTTPLYADSVAGSDANPGTAASPKQTLAGLGTIAANSRFRIARGSGFRESLIYPGFSNVTVAATGTGNPPILDCAVTLPGPYTQPNAGTYPNVWQGIASLATFIATYPSSLNQLQLPVIKNGVQMLRVTSVALVNTTPGSYYAPNDEAYNSLTTSTIYFYASANPNSDGNTYEVPGRYYAIDDGFGSATSTSVSGLHLRNQGGNNGVGDFGVNSSIDRCIFQNGHKHNMLIESGTARRSCGISQTDVGGICFVLYSGTGAGKTGLFQENHFIARPGQTGTINGSATYAHTAGGSNHDRLALEQQSYNGYAFTYDANVVEFISRGCYVRDSGMGAGTSSTTQNTIYLQFRNTRWTVGGANVGSTPGSFTHCSHYASITTGGAGLYRLTGAVTNLVFDYNSFFFEANDTRFAFEGLSGLGTSPFTAKHHVLFMGSGGQGFNFTTAPILTSDYNIFYMAPFFSSDGSPRNTYNGTLYSTLATWQAATGGEANSVYAKAVDQTAGGANALWLAWANAAGGTDLTTVGPAVGDFRINPNARVYTGAGVAKIGVFADGVTPITTAGPQRRWDWNKRTDVAGAPLKWPVCPTTLAECQTFVTSDTWSY